MNSIEQTVVDLAARPTLGGMPRQAMAALVPRSDPELLEELVAPHPSRAARAVLAGSGALRCRVGGTPQAPFG